MKRITHLRRILALVILLVTAALAGACRDSGDDQHFVLDGKLVVFNYRVATATYLINIKPVGPIEKGEMAVVSFEDPAGGEPIVVREKILPNTQRTTIHSPPLRCIVKDRPYKVTIRIDSGGDLLQQIDTTITSSQDQSLLPDKPLVRGPFYDPNPEVAGHPGGDLPGEGAEACPKR